MTKNSVKAIQMAIRVCEDTEEALLRSPLHNSAKEKAVGARIVRANLYTLLEHGWINSTGEILP